MENLMKGMKLSTLLAIILSGCCTLNYKEDAQQNKLDHVIFTKEIIEIISSTLMEDTPETNDQLIKIARLEEEREEYYVFRADKLHKECFIDDNCIMMGDWIFDSSQSKIEYGWLDHALDKLGGIDLIDLPPTTGWLNWSDYESQKGLHALKYEALLLHYSDLYYVGANRVIFGVNVENAIIFNEDDPLKIKVFVFNDRWVNYFFLVDLDTSKVIKHERIEYNSTPH